MRRDIVTSQTAQGGGASAQPPVQGVVSTGSGASEAPAALPAIPEGGGRVVVDHQGDRTIITSAALPPELMPLVHRAEETAIGLMGMLVAIIILGPFARMIARRMERRPEVAAINANTQMLQQQLQELQQSIDAMSVEVERISESQRFQSKLLHEKRTS